MKTVRSSLVPIGDLRGSGLRRGPEIAEHQVLTPLLVFHLIFRYPNNPSIPMGFDVYWEHNLNIKRPTPKRLPCRHPSAA